MKKFLVALFATIMLISLVACTSEQAPKNSDQPPVSSQNEEKPEKKEEQEEENSPKNENTTTIEKQSTFESLDEAIEKDLEDTIAALNSEYEKLVADIDTYDKYIEDTERFEEFYDKIYEDTMQLCIRMREYSINYAELILASDESASDKYDDLEIIYDNIYDDVGDEIYDEIYDGLLDDMYDAFYDGILDDAYDNVPYRDWSDARSDEYGWWSDTRSDVYKKWSDFRSDVYGFWSDMRSELFNKDIEGAKEEILDFQEDIEKLKSKNR